MPRRGGAGDGPGPGMQGASQRQPTNAKVPQLCREWLCSGQCTHGSQCWYCHSQVWQSFPNQRPAESAAPKRVRALLACRHVTWYGL